MGVCLSSRSMLDSGMLVSCGHQISILCSTICNMTCSRLEISFIPLTLSDARITAWLYFILGSLLLLIIMFDRFTLCVPVVAFSSYRWFGFVAYARYFADVACSVNV